MPEKNGTANGTNHRGAALRIRAEYAKLVAPFVSNEETRFYLHGFYAQRHPSGGALIVATDGHSLGCFWDEFGEVTVPGIIALRKTTLAACEDERTLVVEGDRASVYEMWNDENKAGLLVAAQDGAVIDGQFPDWRAVIPNLPAEVEPATFAHRLMHKFKDIRRPGAKTAALRVYASSAKDAALVFTDRDDFIGVIMPIASQIGEHLPRWLPPHSGETAWPNVDPEQDGDGEKRGRGRPAGARNRSPEERAADLEAQAAELRKRAGQPAAEAGAQVH